MQRDPARRRRAWRRLKIVNQLYFNKYIYIKEKEKKNNKVSGLLMKKTQMDKQAIP